MCFTDLKSATFSVEAPIPHGQSIDIPAFCRFHETYALSDSRPVERNRKHNVRRGGRYGTEIVSHMLTHSTTSTQSADLGFAQLCSGPLPPLTCTAEYQLLGDFLLSALVLFNTVTLLVFCSSNGRRFSFFVLKKEEVAAVDW